MADKNWFAANAPTAAAPVASGTPSDWFAANPPDTQVPTSFAIVNGQPVPPEDDSFKFNPDESTAHAMLRYGGNELMGAVRSPLDMLKGLVQAPGAIWKGYTQDIPALLSDPSLLTELPGVAWDAAKYLGTHPEELGSQLGQAVIGAKAVPAVAKGLRPSNIGSAASTFGRFVEGAGGDIASHGVLKGLAKAAVAPAVEKVGQFLQRGGAALEGRPVVTPGESAAGFPRLTPTEAPAAPTPVPQPGESLEGFPRVTPTEAPAAPTPVPQPGESLEGFPRTTPTEAPVPPTPVTQPGESLPGYPRGTVTPPPSIVETLTQRSGAPRAVARPQTVTENLQTRVAERVAPQPMGEVITPELVDPSRMPDALLTAEEKAARDAKSMDRTYQLADASMKGADYAKAKFGTDYWPKLTDAQRAEVAAYERSLTGGVDVEAAQIDQMVNATTRDKFGRAYEDLQPHEQRSVDVLRSRLTGTDAPVTPTQKLAPAPETQTAVPPEEGWITPGETLQSLGIEQSPTAGRGFWKGLRRGDLWPQLQEELLSTAEGPAAPTRPGRTGPGAQGKGGRFTRK